MNMGGPAGSERYLPPGERADNAVQAPIRPFGPIAQTAEHPAFNRVVVGATPTRPIILASRHPAASFRDPYLLGVLTADFRKFGRVCRGERPVQPKLFVNDLDALRRISLNNHIGVDIEVDPLSAWKRTDKAQLTYIAFASTQEAVSFQWVPGAEFYEQLVIQIKEIFEQRRTVWMNGFWFDIPILKRYGFEVQYPEDIRDLRRILAADSPVSLAYLASLYAPLCGPWKEQAETTQDPIYNAEDALRTVQVYVAMLAEIQEQDLPWWTDYGEKLYSQQKRISALCHRMHVGGMLIDEARRGELRVQLRQLGEQRKAALIEACPEFAVSDSQNGPNPNILRTIIYAESAELHRRNFGIVCPPATDRAAKLLRTKTGKPAVDQNALLRIMAMPSCPEELRSIILLYWHAGSPYKALSTFVDMVKSQDAIWEDGRIHPGWNSAANRHGDAKEIEKAGTATRRFACSHPNLMNIPGARDEDDRMAGGLPSILSMYVPAPGHVFIKADYESAELHSMFLNSGDDVLGSMLKSGDVHTATAKLWFGLPPETTKKTINPRVRRTAKEIRFASGYRAAAEKVWTRVVRKIPDITVREVALLLKKFCETHLGLTQKTTGWWDRIHRDATKNGYSEEIFMHHRRHYAVPPEPSDTANFPNQALVASIINTAMVGPLEPPRKALVDGLPQFNGRIVAQKHDEVLVEVPALQADACKAYIVDTMEGPWMIQGKPYRIPVDAKVVTRWG